MNPQDLGGPLVFACDQNWAMPLATTLRSIVEANEAAWPLDIRVISDKFPQAIQQKVLNSLPRGSASIRWASVDLKLFQEFSPASVPSKMIYVRLLLHRFFTDAVSRVLLLDCDLLVLDDLGPLWKTRLDGAVLGAVIDSLDNVIKQRLPGSENLPRVQDYFNAGVLLIDLEKWRRERISEKAFAYLTAHKGSPFQDQDALNVACDGRWKKLDPRWNFQNHWGTRFAELSPTRRPGIVHFVTGSKPWIPRARSANAAFYDDFRSRTCFARTPSEKVRESVWRFLAGVRNTAKRRGFLPEKIQPRSLPYTASRALRTPADRQR